MNTKNFRQGLVGILASAIILVFPGCSNPQKTPKLHFKSLTEIQSNVDNNIKYKDEPEGQDFWKSAKKTEETKEGDCDDTAVYIARDTEKLGYPPLILDLIGVDKETGEQIRHWMHLIKHEFPDGRVQYGAMGQNKRFFKEYPPVTSSAIRIFEGYDTIDEVVYKINEKSRDGFYYCYATFNLNDLMYDWRTSDRNLWDKRFAYFNKFQRVKPVGKDTEGDIQGEIAEKIEYDLGLNLSPEN